MRLQPRSRHTAAADLEHLIADVDTRHMCAGGPRDRNCDAGGPRGDIQDPTRFSARHMFDELTAPPSVLPEREHLGKQVVSPRQVAKQLHRKLVLSAAYRHVIAHTTGTVAGDVERFAAWQRDVLEARAGASEVLTIGPFRVAMSQDKEAPSMSWVTLVDGSTTEAETLKAIPKLKAALKKNKAHLEIEYNEAVFPNVGAWLESAGMKLARKDPLMACHPESFKPFVAPEVHLTQLRSTAIAAELEAFQQIRWTNGGDVKRPVPPIDQLRTALAVPDSVFLLAWLDWEAAGTGLSHSTKGAAEVVGVVTEKKLRRRGVAATVTSELVRRHFDGGGDFVFLDAANEEAAKLYEKLGFSRFGANLVYQ